MTFNLDKGQCKPNKETDQEFPTTLTHEPAKCITRRTTCRAKHTTLDTREIVGRIDAMMRELETMRRQLTTVSTLSNPVSARTFKPKHSMSRDYRLYWDDIQASTKKILQFTRGVSFDSFTNDTKTFDAVVLNLQIIGEAVKNISDSVKAKYPQVDWHRIAGLRDIIAHGYWGLNEELLWDIVQNRLLTGEKIIASEWLGVGFQKEIIGYLNGEKDVRRFL